MVPMKRFTFSTEESLIERARHLARERHTTLNAAFREWLEEYAAQATAGAAYDALMQRLGHIRATGPYSRADMNAHQTTETHF